MSNVSNIFPEKSKLKPPTAQMGYLNYEPWEEELKKHALASSVANENESSSKKDMAEGRYTSLTSMVANSIDAALLTALKAESQAARDAINNDDPLALLNEIKRYYTLATSGGSTYSRYVILIKKCAELLGKVDRTDLVESSRVFKVIFVELIEVGALLQTPAHKSAFPPSPSSAPWTVPSMQYSTNATWSTP